MNRGDREAYNAAHQKTDLTESEKAALKKTVKEWSK